jgi:hypothetical protein
MILVIIPWDCYHRCPGRQCRPDSSIIEKTEQKTMTATRHTRHDMRTLNAHPAAPPLRSQGLAAGAPA